MTTSLFTNFFCAHWFSFFFVSLVTSLQQVTMGSCLISLHRHTKNGRMYLKCFVPPEGRLQTPLKGITNDTFTVYHQLKYVFIKILISELLDQRSQRTWL